MFLYSATLAWVVVATLPVYVILALIVTPLLRARLHETFRRGSENQAFLVESVTGVETIKAMAVEPHMQQRWDEQLAVDASFQALNLGNMASQFANLLQKATTILVLFLGARLVMENALSVGELVAFNMLAGYVSAPVLRLTQLWQDFQQAKISVERLGDILNTPPEPHATSRQASLPTIAGKIEFDHVTFRYRADGQPVLRNVSLTVAAGEVIGIVGPSGSGKSTIAKLIQRLYLPETGRLLVDDQDIALADPAWLRRQIGVMLQENMLFNRTVRDNIALVDPTLPIERIIWAAKLSGAHEFISKWRTATIA
jgi:subfamily B ATP-binding cassette protein HlyB/CyaB